MLARQVRRQDRQPGRCVLGLHRPVHLQGERVGHLAPAAAPPPWVAIRVATRPARLPARPATLLLDPKAGELLQGLPAHPADASTTSACSPYSSLLIGPWPVEHVPPGLGHRPASITRLRRCSRVQSAPASRREVDSRPAPRLLRVGPGQLVGQRASPAAADRALRSSNQRTQPRALSARQVDAGPRRRTAARRPRRNARLAQLPHAAPGSASAATSAGDPSARHAIRTIAHQRRPARAADSSGNHRAPAPGPVSLHQCLRPDRMLETASPASRSGRPQSDRPSQSTGSRSSGSDSQGNPDLRKITRNLSLTFAAFGDTGQPQSSAERTPAK